MLRIILRRSISVLKRIQLSFSSKIKVFYFRNAYPEIRLPWNAIIHRGVVIAATDGGMIQIGNQVKFARHAQVIARGGVITIGDNVQLGDGVLITSKQAVLIGCNTLIAEYVVIRDQDHDYRPRPLRNSGFITGKITIGADCWLGSKASVLRGSTIGDGAIIGAHALVRGDIPAHTLAVGVPARVAKPLAEV